MGPMHNWTRKCKNNNNNNLGEAGGDEVAGSQGVGSTPHSPKEWAGNTNGKKMQVAYQQMCGPQS